MTGAVVVAPAMEPPLVPPLGAVAAVLSPSWPGASPGHLRFDSGG
jgi:hypothetical protein